MDSVKWTVSVSAFFAVLLLGGFGAWVFAKGKPNKKGQDGTPDKGKSSSQEASGTWVQEALEWAAVLATLATIALLLYFFAPGLRGWLANHLPRPSAQPSTITGAQAGLQPALTRTGEAFRPLIDRVQSIPWKTLGLWAMELVGAGLIAFFTLDVFVHKPKSRRWIAGVVAVGLLVAAGAAYYDDLRAWRQGFIATYDSTHRR